MSQIQFSALFFIMVSVNLVACHSAQPERDTNNYKLQGDTIIIPENSNLKSKLIVSAVQKEPYRLQMLTAGTVKAIPTQYAEIAPPFAGRVLKSYVRLGMKVTPETSLFEISSPDFITAQKTFFQEKSQMLLAEKTLKRQQDLISNGVGTQKDLEEAQTAYEVAKKEYENAVIGIKIFKADPDNLVLGQPLVVKAPITGEIIDNKIVVGKFINDNASSVAIVAELSKVWVAGQIKEKDIRFIHELDECNIEIAALPEKHIKGKVYHVNEIVDEDTRSVQVLIECDNKDHTLKPGMYVTVDFINAPTSAILIPAKAVMQANDESFVFVEVSSDKYLKRKIEPEGSENSKIVIKSGLNENERIISEGGFYLLNAK
ncbi:MAG: efflux RND transporter periplasmic adaptor subunit [Bacteroidetes bacterium]|nr:efflux RND transporter periplasmic adaptor subunit [Bacteroidota bacterium]